MKLNLQQLLEYFQVSESTVITNFPTFCANQLKKGFLITKIGKGKNALYEIEQVEPQNKNSSEFSSRGQNISKDLKDEVWITTYIDKNFEVSNLGRIRNKKTKVLHQGSLTKDGYCQVSILNKNYKVHRIVLQSFNPMENFEELTVDHINGIRSDNKLENLRWETNENNVRLMLLQRADLNKELTRIIQKYGYDKTLKILQEL